MVSARQKVSSRSFLQSQNIIDVSSSELLKAACCNLAESFETNPSMDVNFVDAISGTKQIKMLGLSSPYIMVTTENVASVRRASQAYGMSFIPGTWRVYKLLKELEALLTAMKALPAQLMPNFRN